MYENFYGLKEKPFQIVPNPDYLYMSSIHENALTYLEYGLMENVGFILLTGKVGTGKTTLVRYIMNQFESKKDIAVIFNTNVSANELICLILKSLEQEPDPGNKTKNIDLLYQFLIDRYAQKRPVLLIIDEAQNLSDEAIEEVRMLSNLQSDDQNLIQVMLVGQPELKDRLQQPCHTPFAQRIAVNFFLTELTDKETESYITYRLEKAGGKPDIFSSEAIELIYQTSQGIPRTINLLCDTALVYGFGYEFNTIEPPVIEQVIKDKGGMGIHTENKHKAGSFSLSDSHEAFGMYEDRLQKLEDVIVLMKRKMNYIVKHMVKLEDNIKGVQDSLNGSLKNLIVQERNQHNKLLAAYSKLKVKYDSLFGKQDEKKLKRR
jgi:general secretion pathway protein A